MSRWWAGTHNCAPGIASASDGNFGHFSVPKKEFGKKKKRPCRKDQRKSNFQLGFMSQKADGRHLTHLFLSFERQSQGLSQLSPVSLRKKQGRKIHAERDKK